MHIHLAARAEDDAILIDHVDLSRGFDRAQDLGRHTRGIVYFVEGDPLRDIGASCALVEEKGGVSSHVE